MPTLEHNRLVFRFPQIEKEARFSIDFRRTLRIDSGVLTAPCGGASLSRSVKAGLLTMAAS